jgi:hypothetical protein
VSGRLTRGTRRGIAAPEQPDRKQGSDDGRACER